MRAPASLLLLALWSALRPASSVPLTRTTTAPRVPIEQAEGKTACPFYLETVYVGETELTGMVCLPSPARNCCRKEHVCVQLIKQVEVPGQHAPHPLEAGCACMEERKARLATNPSPPHT